MTLQLILATVLCFVVVSLKITSWNFEVQIERSFRMENLAQAAVHSAQHFSAGGA